MGQCAFENYEYINLNAKYLPQTAHTPKSNESKFGIQIRIFKFTLVNENGKEIEQRNKRRWSNKKTFSGINANLFPLSHEYRSTI